MRVRVIDDDPQVRSKLSIVPRAKGFPVKAVESDVVGLKEYRDADYDLATVDIYIPG